MYCYNIFTLLTLITVTVVHALNSEHSDEDDFKKFKGDYQKQYRDSVHEGKSFGHFKKNRAAIIAHNKRYNVGEVHYRLEINERADWGPEDHQKVNNYVPPTKEELKNMPQHKIKGPKRSKRQTGGPILGYDPFDWRDQGVIPPVRNQGGCGVCGLFSKTLALSAAMAIQRDIKPPIPLSVQAVDDCDYGNLTITKALDTPLFIMKYGVPTEADYPYMAGTNGTYYCVNPYNRTQNSGHCYMWNGMNLVQPYIDRTNLTAYEMCAGCGGGEDDVGMIDGLINGGPLVVGVASACIGFSYYGSGIVYNTNCTSGVDHAITIVGIGVDTVLSVSDSFTCQNETIPYYIIQNSWGTGFGEGGYAKIAIGNNGVRVGTGGKYPTLTTGYTG